MGDLRKLLQPLHGLLPFHLCVELTQDLEKGSLQQEQLFYLVTNGLIGPMVRPPLPPRFFSLSLNSFQMARCFAFSAS